MPTTAESSYSDNSRYHRHRARDQQARAGHADVSRQWRRALADAAFNAGDRERLVAAVRAGATVAEAAAALSLTPQQVYGRASWDTEFAAELDDALAQTCPAGAHCGTATGARHHGGRCRDCRRAHHASRTRKEPR